METFEVDQEAGITPSTRLRALFDSVSDFPEWERAMEKARDCVGEIIRGALWNVTDSKLRIPISKDGKYLEFDSWYDAESYFFDVFRERLDKEASDDIRAYAKEGLLAEEIAEYIQFDLRALLEKLHASFPGFPGVCQTLDSINEKEEGEEEEDSDEPDEQDEHALKETRDKAVLLVGVQTYQLLALSLKKAKESYDENKLTEVETHLRNIGPLVQLLHDLPDDCGC
jgi:hypothetical protein